MSSTEKAKAPLYFGWYVCAATVFVAFVTTGARSSFGIFIIPLEEEFGSCCHLPWAPAFWSMA